MIESDIHVHVSDDGDEVMMTNSMKMLQMEFIKIGWLLLIGRIRR